MEELIEDVLTLARAGESISDTEPVELTALVQECRQTVEMASASLATDREVSVQADETRLRQLLENLLRNAVEHGGGRVTVTVGSLDEGFYLEDDGPGIPTDDREEVFEAGYSTNQEGTGVGLSIVKQVAEAHGWEICVTESETGGARFEITGVEFAAE
jgi:signal transduction histidine kinase